MSRIYVFCPSYLVSGGPDALHQIVYYLRKINLDAHIVYVDLRKKKYQVPKCYQEYVGENDYGLISEVIDDGDSIIICPETLTFLLDGFQLAQKYVWWLSVNNDTERSSFFEKLKILFRKLSPRQIVKQLKKNNKWLNFKYFLNHKKFDFNTADEKIIHLCASYYAYDYVKKNNAAKQYLCIEPISKFFLENLPSEMNRDRKDIVIYNPAKNYKFTKRIIRHCKGIQFLALSGYSQNELLNLYRNSKLYIDFGSFPGAERIPKEAVINGCCVMTGRNGASDYYNDVPLCDELKMDSKLENLEAIKEKINSILTDYDRYYGLCEEYRTTVKSLEDSFIQQLSQIFLESKS